MTGLAARRARAHTPEIRATMQPMLLCLVPTFEEKKIYLKAQSSKKCANSGKIAPFAVVRVAEVWTQTKNLCPNIHYFVAILRLFVNYTFYRAFIEL